MENIFRPSKWFVVFCGALVVVWAVLQLVSNLRVADEAKRQAREIFAWQWPGKNLVSSAEITEATVVRRTDTDAIVRVKGRQTIKTINAGTTEGVNKESTEAVDCGAILTFYRSSNHWVLGKAELLK
ncbi:MAG: hypothetical protein HY711_08535 [Candidatus Melainabacteria bacterium]|nr:hypothetical protein [Candidatus Melainabacteria bacterium]